MIKNKAVFIVALLCLAFSVTNAGDIIYVDANSSNDPGTGTSEDPFRRIQDAINSSISGDTVQIAPGVYTGAGNYDLDPLGKSITISSTNPEDAEIIANTVIDPNGAGRGFNIQSGEDANCIILGVTIRNAFFDGDGGAIVCSGTGSVIRNCIIIGNRSRYGGGVAGVFGGAPTLINCSIVKNSAYFNGGGIYCFGGDVDVKNCIVWQNEAVFAQDDKGHQIGLEYESTASIAYTDVQGGSEGVSTSEYTLFWQSGNIDSDPCFASLNPAGDQNLWDFHLKSTAGRWNSTFYSIDLNKDGIINLFEFARLAGVWQQQGILSEDLDYSGIVDWADLKLFAQYYLANSIEDGWITDSSTSPCIDAGDPNSDWSAEPWPNGKRINMGAYGGTAQASKSGNIADFNVNGKVNFIDFALLAGLWNEDITGIEDLNGDETVNARDLDILAENWLWEK